MARNTFNSKRVRSSMGALLSSVLLCFGIQVYAGTVELDSPIANDTPDLTADEVRTIVTQGVAFLKKIGETGIISVTDREGHILALYRMTQSAGTNTRINEQATTKARTASFFQSDFGAFSTLTASFIVQSHFPPKINNVDAGPLFGVPFSSIPASDIQLQQPPFIVFVNGVNAPGALDTLGSANARDAGQPLVITPITDDFGGLPLFKPGSLRNPQAVGAVGVEIDAFGILRNGIPDGATPSKRALEEQAALAASKGFRPPGLLQATRITINGFRLPYLSDSAFKDTRLTATHLANVDLAADGAFEPFFDTNGSERDSDGVGVGADLVTPYAAVSPQAVIISAAQQPRATPSQEFPRQGWVPRFTPRDTPLGDGSITAADVRAIVQQAANKALQTRAAIRRPVGRPAAVWIAVCDRDGNLCGVFRTEDATVFSFDVAVQKARTSAFFSSATCAFSTRALGFLAQTTYPPGIADNPAGPISGLTFLKPNVDTGALGAFPIDPTLGSGALQEISQLLVDRGDTLAGLTLADAVRALSRRLPHIRDGRLSPLQVAITVDLTFGRPTNVGEPVPPATTIPNGITIFAGGVPLYRNGILIGAVGISGDGIDQDDLMAITGANGFQPPDGIRCDNANRTAIVTQLQAAVAKLQTQFPNLTNGTDGVLDFIAAHLAKNGPSVLQDLRLPYVKTPRQPDRQ